MIATMMIVLIPIVLVILVTSYGATTTIEDLKTHYAIVFSEAHEDFGTVLTDKTYIATKCKYYRFWERSDKYHYRDENGVNQYLDVLDAFLKPYYTVTEVK